MDETSSNSITKWLSALNYSNARNADYNKWLSKGEAHNDHNTELVTKQAGTEKFMNKWLSSTKTCSNPTNDHDVSKWLLPRNNLELKASNRRKWILHKLTVNPQQTSIECLWKQPSSCSWLMKKTISLERCSNKYFEKQPGGSSRLLKKSFGKPYSIYLGNSSSYAWLLKENEGTELSNTILQGNQSTPWLMKVSKCNDKVYSKSISVKTDVSRANTLWILPRE